MPAFNFLFSSKDKALKHYRRYRTSDITDLLKKYFQIKKISYFNFFLFIPIALSIFFMKLKKEKFIDFAETTPFYPINFILTENEKRGLIDMGYQAARDYFDKSVKS